MIGCLRTRVRKQSIIAFYFEFENDLKFYNLEARFRLFLSVFKCLFLLVSRMTSPGSWIVAFPHIDFLIALSSMTRFWMMIFVWLYSSASSSCLVLLGSLDHLWSWIVAFLHTCIDFLLTLPSVTSFFCNVLLVLGHVYLPLEVMGSFVILDCSAFPYIDFLFTLPQ